MTGASPGAAPCLIVVGDPCSEFVRTMVRLAREYRVEAVSCDDVYSAVAAMAQAAGRRTLVVGSIQELAREDCRCFRIADGNSVRCCCLLDRRAFGVAGGALAAVRAGAAVVGEAGEVRPILKEWLTTGGHRAVRRNLGDLADEDLRATEAELIALLGQGTDE